MKTLQNDFGSIQVAFSKIDVKNANATDPKDKEMILRNILKEGTMEEMNNDLMAMMRGWIVRTGRQALFTNYSDELAHTLANLEKQLGNHKEAKALYLRALAGKEKN